MGDLAGFWARVSKTPRCWEWTGASNGRYGQFRMGGRKTGTHRISWELHFGDIPAGQMVCHRCDNPACVRPSHLFLGSQKDNMRDCAEKGRCAMGAKRGVEHCRHKLTEDQVTAIRRLRLLGHSCQRIAMHFGVTKMTVSRIARRESWSHV